MGFDFLSSSWPKKDSSGIATITCPILQTELKTWFLPKTPSMAFPGVSSDTFEPTMMPSRRHVVQALGLMVYLDPRQCWPQRCS